MRTPVHDDDDSGQGDQSEPPALDRQAEVEHCLGYRFADPALLQTALTHRSFAHENGTTQRIHYERLEFLGDSVLGFVVSDWLYRDDVEAAEGSLSRRRQAVVRTATLARAAETLGLGEAILLGRGEELTGGRRKTSLLADVFEAVLGAVYLDGGIRSARSFVKRHLGDRMRETRTVISVVEDYKTRLQEAIQGRLRRTPHYRIVSTSGPDHALQFEVDVLLGEEVLGHGAGASRKSAEQNAARKALRQLEGVEE